MSGDRIRIHAIYAVAGDEDLFPASLRSIYDQVDGITVITGYDTDWSGRARGATGPSTTCCTAGLDPERRVQILIERETNEARSRNRAMDFAAGFARGPDGCAGSRTTTGSLVAARLLPHHRRRRGLRGRARSTDSARTSPSGHGPSTASARAATSSTGPTG